jgi:hypothetical protein
MLGGDGSQFPPKLDLDKSYEERLINAKTKKKEFGNFLEFEHTLDDISGKKRLYVYNPDISRSVYLTYERESEVRGIKAYRYFLFNSKSIKLFVESFHHFYISNLFLFLNHQQMHQRMLVIVQKQKTLI